MFLLNRVDDTGSLPATPDRKLANSKKTSFHASASMPSLSELNVVGNGDTAAQPALPAAPAVPTLPRVNSTLRNIMVAGATLAAPIVGETDHVSGMLTTPHRHRRSSSETIGGSVL